MNTLRLPPIEQSMEQLMEQAGRVFATEDTPGRRSDILRHLRQIAATTLTGQYSESTFRQWLADIAQSNWNSSTQELLTPAFTVGETYFRRDPAARAYLQSELLPDLLRRQPKTLRVWSAGCCTGEEPYDQAILATEATQQFSPKTTVRVIGTDLNKAFLEQARAGRYRKTSFRGSDDSYRLNWFIKDSSTEWQIKPQISRKVSFEQLNLGHQRTPKACQEFDLILCRNVLMYFRPEVAYQVLNNFIDALSTNGIMLIGAVEASLVTEAGFEGFWAGDNYAVTKPQQKGLQQNKPNKRSAERTFNTEQFVKVSPTVTSKADPVAPFKRYVKPSLSQLAKPNAEATDNANKQANVLKLAEESFETKNYSAAIPHFLELLGTPGIAQSPKAAAMKRIARCYLALNDIDEAMSWVSEAMLIAPRDPELFVLLAQIHEHYGQFDEALSYIDKAIYLEPELSLPYFLKGTIHQKLRQFPKATKAWQNCVAQSIRMGDSEVRYGEGLNHKQLASLGQQLINEANQRG